MILCHRCSELFCTQCTHKTDLQACPRCQHPAVKVTIESADIPECDFDWVLISGPPATRIGICDLDRIPPKIPIERLISTSPHDVEFVLCKNSDSVQRNSTELQKKQASQDSDASDKKPILAGMPFPSSGFRAVYRGDKAPFHLEFLNISGFDSSELAFIIKYIHELYSVYTAMDIDTSRLTHAIYETEAEMHRRYGYSSRMHPEVTRMRVEPAHLALMRCWADHVTMKRVLANSDFSEVSRYVHRRITLTREGVEHFLEDLPMWGSYYQLFGIYLNICSVLMALPSDSPLRLSSIREVFQIHDIIESAANRMHVPSLGPALRIILDELLHEEVYSSQKSFETLIPRSIEKSRPNLKPQFHEPMWIMSLCDEANQHMIALSLAPEFINESRIQDLILECKRVKNAGDAFALTAWMAGRARLDLLIALAYYIGDPSLCPEIEKVALDNLQTFRHKVQVINDICPDIPATFGEILLDVSGAMHACHTLGYIDGYRRLREIVVSEMYEPTAAIVRLNIQWTDFFIFEDYDALLSFRSTLSEIMASDDPLKGAHELDFEMRKPIADGILSKEGRHENLLRGRLRLLQAELCPQMAIKDSLQYSAFERLLTSIDYLYRAAESVTPQSLALNLSEAMFALEYIKETEKPTSPGYLSYLKTLLLEKMTLGEVETVVQMTTEIRRHPYHSKWSEPLLVIAERWSRAKDSTIATVFSALETDDHSPSPWTATARRIVSSDARKAYTNMLQNRHVDMPAREKGRLSDLKGRVLELALEVCYWSDGYVVQHRPRKGHREHVDLLCHKKFDRHCEIVLVDVKSGKDSYEPKDARDFISRVHNLRKEAPKIIGLDEDCQYHVHGIIASKANVSDGAKEELESGFKTETLSFIVGHDLKEFLAAHDVNLPSIFE